MTDPVIKEFIERARAVRIDDALATRLKLKLSKRGHEHAQPCPVCAGRDRFSFNTKKNLWNCRGAGAGGHDAIGLAAHIHDLDLRRREHFLQACADALGEEIPAGGERESDGDRAARLARIEALRLKAYEEMAARQADAVDWRERERVKARGIHDAAMPIISLPTGPAHLYLRARAGGVPRDRWLRVAADLPYWHGSDELGRPIAIHAGPAMIAPFVGADDAIIGCHITWIDLARQPKFRPALFDPETGEELPTKKMRGSKKGGLIPIAGAFSARRWVGGEGIENGVVFGRWEGFRDDSFYFAAGDLGNLAGPAEPTSRFAHPTLKKEDRNNRLRPLMVPGPLPRRDQADDDAMWVPDHVDELVLLGDGDSEPVMTAAAMARARRRHARPGRLIPIVWPKGGAGAGYDFARMSAEAEAGRA